MEDFIGIGGIFATIIVGILSSKVTWEVAKKSQKIMKLLWSAEISQVREIVPEPFRLGQSWISHADENKYTIQIKVKNIGNVAIVSPIMLLNINNCSKVISRGLGNIPYGYENKWKLCEINDKEYKIALEHINPQQEFTVTLYAYGRDDPNITFSCPMENVSVLHS